MHEDSIVLIDDLVVPDVGAHRTVMQMDITMLVATAAEERTERRWRGLVESSGLYIDRFFHYDRHGGDCVIMARPQM